MINRCHNKNHKDYYLYGKRGITVSKRWHIIANFIKDMYPTYKKGLYLDRIDNNKEYSKNNCRWSTAFEQANNTRKNVRFNGKTIAQQSREIGLAPNTILMRIRRGWSKEKAFNEPLKI